MIKEMLDIKDRKILFELDKDCRQSDSEIGKKVRLSKQAVKYRIENLLGKGIITRFSSVIDTYKLGYSKYKLYLSLEGATKEDFSQIINFLKDHKKTEWIATCSGKWDIIAGYLVKDIYEFDESVRELEENFSRFISEKETTITLEVPHWRKEYLLDNKINQEAVYQGGRKKMDLDKTDEEIVKILVNNARMPIIEIARRTKTTPRVAGYRLKNLIRQKIVILNRVFMDLNKFDWIYCKAFLRLKNPNEKKIRELIEYLGSLRNLTYLIKCIGSWDMELDFEIENFNRFHETMSGIKERFPDLIKNHDFVIIMNEDKLDYYPGAYPRMK
jgi:DNA-binding Lrp family transcriptional regulator